MDVMGVGESSVALWRTPKPGRGPVHRDSPEASVGGGGGGGRPEGEPGTAPSPPWWEEEGKAGPWGPEGEPARRGCCQGGHRGAGGKGASPQGDHLGLKGLSPGRACPGRPLCPWLPSQGQTFPDVGSHRRGGEDRGQVGAAPSPLSPAAGGHASKHQAQGWELSADGEAAVPHQTSQANSDACQILL